MAKPKKPTAKAAATPKPAKAAATGNAKYDASLETKQEAIREAARKRAAQYGQNPTNLPDLAPGAYLVKKLSFINGTLYNAGETVQLPEGVEPGRFLKPLGKNPSAKVIATVLKNEELFDEDGKVIGNDEDEEEAEEEGQEQL